VPVFCWQGIELESFDEDSENLILDLIQSNFGFEIFTPGLERSRPIYLSFVQKFKFINTKIITVGGTNGKGQTCHTIHHYLNNAKINSALWTSPHILSIRERFVYNNEQISYSELENIIQKSILEIKKFGIQISFYEFLFFVFLNWVSKFDIKVLILEVGLGGRLDAVNHFDCDLAVITSISRDHQAILGNSYLKILHEKLGIMRANKYLLTAFKSSYLNEITEEETRIKNVNWISIPLEANYYDTNIKVAQTALNKLGLVDKFDGIIPNFKGRNESLYFGNNKLLFIGAHNPDGFRESLKFINIQNYVPNYILLSFSKRDFKDLLSMLKMLNEASLSNCKIYLSGFNHPKAEAETILQDVLNSLCNNKRIEFIKDWKSFLNGIKNDFDKNQILLLGSYYFIGEVQRFVLNNK
jgi:dihydrofolate synthase/folylpolyglutamate synthase